MRVITSLCVARQHENPSSLWGDDLANHVYRNLRNMAVVVTRDHDALCVTVYGVDPDHLDPEVDTIVFAKTIPLGELGALLALIIDNDGRAIDIPVPQPPPQGPKLRAVFAYARAISADAFANQVGAA